MPINFITVKSLKTRYLEINNNNEKYFLFLPGWSGTIDSWQNFLALFETEKINIRCLDLPGFGKSQTPNRPWSIADYSEFIKDFLEEKGLKKVYLFGHSFGGQIAAQFAHDYPEKLEKLFLCGAAAIRPKPTVFKNFLKILAKTTQKIWPKTIRRFLYKLLGNLDYGELNDPIMKQTMQNAISTDLQNILPEIKTPTIIIWGKDDTYTPLKQGLLIKKLLPNNKMYTLDNARHGVHLQQPRELKKIILENLN